MYIFIVIAEFKNWHHNTAPTFTIHQSVNEDLSWIWLRGSLQTCGALRYINVQRIRPSTLLSQLRNGRIHHTLTRALKYCYITPQQRSSGGRTRGIPQYLTSSILHSLSVRLWGVGGGNLLISLLRTPSPHTILLPTKPSTDLITADWLMKSLMI